MRLIDAEPYKDCMIVSNDEGKGICVKDIPTVDAVPIVLCIDCKWWTKENESYHCKLNLRNNRYDIGRPYLYCSVGEQKDGEIGEVD